jgi:hypothetical protein
MEVRDYVLKLAGPDLTALGASDFKDFVNGEESAFLFSLAERRVAVSWSPRGGLNGYVSDANQADDASYSTWPTIWVFAGLPQAQDFEQLDKIIDQFPTNSDDVVRFIIATLRERLH